MGDFDKLSFGVEVVESSYDTTISRLDAILKKLEQIQNATNAKIATSISVKGIDTSSVTKKAQTAINQQKNSLLSLEKAQESYSSAIGRWENSQASLRNATINLSTAEERYDEALRNPLATLREMERAERSLEKAQIARTRAQNNADIAEQNVGNAQRTIEQRENSYVSAELRTERALLSEIDKFQERISRNEQLQTSTGYQQALEKQVKLLQDKKLLLAQNESKTIGTNEDVELRALQLQNEERRKAVDLEIKRNGALSEGFKNFSESGQLNETDKKVAKDKGEYQAYLDLQKLVEQEERLNSAWAKQIETLRLLNQEKQKKLTYDIISNDSNVRAENVATKIAQLNANTAVSADLAASAEGRLALEEKARVQYGQQLITQMERLRAEQDAINNGKYEEYLHTKLANDERKKEIKQRTEQELGINKTTKSLASYIAKITSVFAIARRLGSFVVSAVETSAAYVENLNLFAIAYGDAYEDTLDWALGLAKSYGLANNEIVKMAGTFRQLATSLGIVGEMSVMQNGLKEVGETADFVSEQVTSLAYDFSALLNTSVESAAEKLQSSIFSGNVRPLRAYGIDISQSQIDRLFETNEQLAALGINARNLSQSDKVLARLIITMQSGSNAFGTMAREINTLQSQIRIFQGSLTNFKQAVGNFLNEPLRNAMIYINGVIIGITELLNAFAPEIKTVTLEATLDQNGDETATGVLEGVKDAANDATSALEGTTDEYENLTNKLAGFDKFNVLQQGQNTGSSAATGLLQQILGTEMEKYQAEVDEAMKEVENRAVEIGNAIKNWFIFDVGTKDNPIYEMTSQAKGLLAILTTISGISVFNWAKSAMSAATEATKAGKSLEGIAKTGATLKNILSPKGLGIIAFVGAIAYMYTTNEQFRESINKTINTLVTALEPVLKNVFGLIETFSPIVLRLIEYVANIAGKVLEWADNMGILEPILYAIIGIGLAKWLFNIKKPLLECITLFGMPAKDALTAFANTLKTEVQPKLLDTIKNTAQLQAVIGAVGAIAGFALFDSFLSGLDSTSKAIAGLITVLAAGTIAWIAFNAAKTQGLAVPLILTAIGVGAAGVKAMFEGIQGFADGGYTNANLIMTHENGKREWVGKAAGSAAIVNDTQMSDIMEAAVAKGVYRAFSNSRTESSSGGTTKNVYNFQVNGKTLLSAMEDEARKQGKKLARY